MGGYGSGRKDGQLKTLVEGCFGLSVKTIKRNIKDIDQNGGIYYGTVYWTSGGEKEAEISYKVYKKNENVFVRLIYQTTHWKTREVTYSDYPIKFQHTVPNYGGKRYWFTCPLIVDSWWRCVSKACREALFASWGHIFWLPAML